MMNKLRTIRTEQVLVNTKELQLLSLDLFMLGFGYRREGKKNTYFNPKGKGLQYVKFAEAVRLHNDFKVPGSGYLKIPLHDDRLFYFVSLQANSKGDIILQNPFTYVINNELITEIIQPSLFTTPEGSGTI